MARQARAALLKTKVSCFGFTMTVLYSFAGIEYEGRNPKPNAERENVHLFYLWSKLAGKLLSGVRSHNHRAEGESGSSGQA